MSAERSVATELDPRTAVSGALATDEVAAGPAPASSDDEAIRGRIRRIFVEEMELDVDADMDLIEGGVLDSMVFVQLLVHLEEEFGVTVDVETLDLEDFRSAASIARYVVSSR